MTKEKVEGNYTSAKEIKEKYHLSPQTLRSWHNKGIIKAIQTPGGKRLYQADSLRAVLGIHVENEKEIERIKLCYCRVSSNHQKEDLGRQVAELEKAYPEHTIIKDIGSGLNWKRHGFNSLLDQVFKGMVSEVVVAYKDRLCRFGFELVERIFKEHHVKLVVHSSDATNQVSDTQELSEDLLSIVTVFVAKNNGKRAANNRKRRAQENKSKKQKRDQESDSEDSSSESDQD